ncbi:MAG: stage III sporulation protein AF [Clostridia bacterium]|nr:stage III sporulation protein AF [Clostridia bacterium]
MELFKDWAMTIAGIVVFGSACEVILPGGSFRKYTRLAIGLILIVTMLKPFQGVSKGTLSLPEITVESYTQRAQMEESQKEEVGKLYRQNLARKMEASLKEALGQETIKVSCQVEEEDMDTFGTVQQVEVLIKAKTNEDLQHQATEVLHRDFGIHPERIAVRYLKESEE